MRLLAEIGESTAAAKALLAAGGVPDMNQADDTQREMSLMTYMRMITCVVRAMDDSPQILLSLQAPLQPLITEILRNVAIGAARFSRAPPPLHIEAPRGLTTL